MGLVTVLLVGLVLVILVAGIHLQAMSSTGHVSRFGSRLQARYAALGGVQVALSRLKADPEHRSDIVGAVSFDDRLEYRVELLNNFSGGAPVPAPDGTMVPPGSVHLTATAGRAPEELVLTAMATSEAGAPGDASLFAARSIDMSGGSYIGPWNGAGPMTLGTNVESPGRLELSGGSRIDADITIGPAGDPATAADLSGGSTTGPITNATDLTVITPQAAPAVTPPLQNVSLSGGDQFSLPPGAYRNVSLSGFSKLYLTSGTYVIDGSFSLSGASVVTCEVPTGPVTIFVKNSFSFSGGAQVNMNGRPADLLLYFTGPGSTDFSLSGGSDARMIVHGARTQGDFSGGSRLYGAFMGESLELSSGSRVLYDVSLGGATAASPAGRWVLHSIKG